MTIKTGSTALACTVLTMLLGACTLQQQSPSGGVSDSPAPRPVPNINLSGYPPAFKDGFSDGCESLRGNYRRDAARFGKDNNYTLGWQDGYSICGRQKR